jgi:hypothetical protein
MNKFIGRAAADACAGEDVARKSGVKTPHRVTEIFEIGENAAGEGDGRGLFRVFLPQIRDWKSKAAVAQRSDADQMVSGFRGITADSQRASRHEAMPVVMIGVIAQNLETARGKDGQDSLLVEFFFIESADGGEFLFLTHG